MRTLIAIAIVVLASRIASAQPAPGPALAPPSATPMTPPPSPRYLQIDPEDQQLLADGETSDGQWIGGGVASILVGFGVGQAVESRWTSRGWIFTLGEAVGVVVLVDEAARSFNGTENDGVLVGSALALGALRIWEIVDAWAVPPRRNARIRELRLELGLPPPPPGYSFAPAIIPVHAPHGDTMTAGLQVRF